MCHWEFVAVCYTAVADRYSKEDTHFFKKLHRVLRNGCSIIYLNSRWWTFRLFSVFCYWMRSITVNLPGTVCRIAPCLPFRAHHDLTYFWPLSPFFSSQIRACFSDMSCAESSLMCFLQRELGKHLSWWWRSSFGVRLYPHWLWGSGLVTISMTQFPPL